MSFRSAQAGRRPKAFVPIEIGLLGRLRAKRRPSPTRGGSFWLAQADHRPEAFSGRIHSARQADRWPKALRGRIHPACPAPGVGLRRREECLSGRRRPTDGRGLLGPNSFGLPGRPLAEGPSRPDSSGVPRAKRRPSPTRRVSFWSAQADRWPEAFSGRIHSACQADRWPEAFRGRIHSTGGSQDGGEGDAAGHRGIPG
jgi:hypothetical protein